MNDQQENRFSHFEKVNTWLQQHKDELTATPAISATLQPQLKTCCDKISEDDSHAVQDNTGYGDSKEDIEEKLELMADHVGSGLESYADDIDDFVLMNSVEFTLSQIRNFRDSRLQQYGEFVYGKATDAAIKPILISDHNITQADIDTLGSLITTYRTASPLPQEMKGEAAAWGKQVDRDFVEGDKVMARIRRKMNTYRSTNPLLFDSFTAVDSVDDTGSHKSKDTKIAPGKTVPVASIVYKADAVANLENTGDTELSFQLFSNNVAVGKVLKLAAGSKQAVPLGDLAPEGDELRATNEHPTLEGSCRVSI